MSAVRIAGGGRLSRGVPAVVAGLVSVAALAANGPAHASAAAGTRVAAAARAAASGGTWGTAEEIPGTAALASDGSAYPTSVSCASAGNCSAGGAYTTFVNEPGPQEAFVVGEVNGTWGTAEEVPGTAALNVGGYAEITSVSCASAGNCSAGGVHICRQRLWPQSGVRRRRGQRHLGNGGGGARHRGPQRRVRRDRLGVVRVGGQLQRRRVLLDNSGHRQAFVVNETNGTWGKAEEVPGTAALNTGGIAEIASVSCASAGNCSAGGDYATRHGRSAQAFVVSETNGTWGKAEEVPGTAALNTGGEAGIASVSCASAGNCSAGGYYTDSSGHDQAFVVSETNGTWGKAEEVPGTAALNTGGDAEVASVSCASAGNCSAGGVYEDSSGHRQAFVVNETNGTWGKAEEVPGTAALNTGGFAEVASVSCASAGNCSAGGDYIDGSGNPQAFVVSEANGTWGKAEEVPGITALNKEKGAVIHQVSCASAGHCSAVGYYATRYFDEAFVVNET